VFARLVLPADRVDQLPRFGFLTVAQTNTDGLGQGLAKEAACGAQYPFQKWSCGTESGHMHLLDLARPKSLCQSKLLLRGKTVRCFESLKKQISLQRHRQAALRPVMAEGGG
jgi:hypothetical protein